MALTSRQGEVLALAVEGYPSKRIAARLGVSEKTVQYHLDQTYRKLRVANRTEAACKAIEHGLVPPPLVPGRLSTNTMRAARADVEAHHTLINDLTLMQGYGELLARDTRLPRWARGQAAEIQRAARRAAKLLHRLSVLQEAKPEGKGGSQAASGSV